MFAEPQGSASKGAMIDPPSGEIGSTGSQMPSSPEKPALSGVRHDEEGAADDDDPDEEEEFFEDDYAMLVDVLESVNDPNDPANYAIVHNPDLCTVEEARAYRKLLRDVGPEAFVEATIDCESITAKKLITAFGIRPPEFLEGRPDSGYYQLLGLCIARQASSRQKLFQYNTIEDAVELLRNSRNVLVITGAGISTNLGVPDFRSTKTGFYAKMKELGFESPEEIFEITTFDETPNIFFENASETLPAPGKSTPTHQFIKLLDDKDILLTNYTQNIDNIEGNVGISTTKLIQCHGSWATFTCRKCKSVEPGQKYYEAVRNKEIPRCPKCIATIVQKPSNKRKRSANTKARRSNEWDDDSDDDDDDGRYTIEEPGVMKPDITFFGEQLPDRFFKRFADHDREKADLAIVIGTSMMVAPVSEIPVALPPEVPCIYISRDPATHIEFDITLLGDCDLITNELARRAGWTVDHPMLPREQKVLEVVPREGRVATWHVRPKNEPDPAEVAKERGEAEV